MIHFVLHDAKDTVAVVVVEGVTAGTDMTGWIMDEDKTIKVQAKQDMKLRHTPLLLARRLRTCAACRTRTSWRSPRACTAGSAAKTLAVQ